MPKSSNGSAGVALLLVLASLALAAANLVVVVGLGPNGAEVVAALRAGNVAPLLAGTQSLWASTPLAVLLPCLGPVLLGLLGAAVSGRKREDAAPPVAVDAPAAPAGPQPEEGALQLLGLLQHEARFIDFIQEDIAGYDDAQVGAAVREIHANCRKALAERIHVARIYDEEDEATVEVEAGFDPAAIRLTGNVAGEPPFKGSLQHCGWRVVDVTWPSNTGSTNARILAPAEVEVG